MKALKILGLLIMHYTAVAQQWTWANSPGLNEAIGVCTDKWGNIYTICRGVGDGKYAGASIPTDGHLAGAVAKYSNTGTLLWVASIDEANAMSIATNDSGMVFVASTSKYPATFFGSNKKISTASNSYNHIFVSKYDANGNIIWVNDYNDSDASDDFQSAFLKCDKFGNFVIACGPSARYQYAPQRVTVKKVSSDGKILWQSISNWRHYTEVFDMAVDNSGNCMVIGRCIDTLELQGSQLLPGKSGESTFFAKFNSSGLLQDIKRFNFGFQVSICNDKANDIVLTSNFYDSCRIGNVTYKSTNKAFANTIVAKFDSLINLIWARTASGLVARDVVCDDNNNIVMTGDMTEKSYFDPSELSISPTKKSDIFVAKYNSSGVLNWAITTDGVPESGNMALTAATDPFGGVWIGGQIGAETGFGEHDLNVTSQSAFFAKIDGSNMTGQIGSLLDKNVRIYPVPSDRYVTLDLDDDATDSTIKIFDMLGAEVYAVELIKDSNQQYKLDFSKVTDGVYFVSILTSATSVTKKIVIESN